MTTLPRDIVRTYRHHCPNITPHPLPLELANMYRPGVQINNMCFENSIHRKLHVETAHVGMVHVVHSVSYPRAIYDAPIFALDNISVGKTSTFAIVDACPVTDTLELPTDYADALVDIQKQYGIRPTPRKDMPSWGREIFSDCCYIAKKQIDREQFAAYVLACLAMHLQYCNTLRPSLDHMRIRKNHLRFCRMQLKNDKTRSTLASALGGDLQLANEYMNRVMFDY